MPVAKTVRKQNNRIETFTIDSIRFHNIFISTFLKWHPDWYQILLFHLWEKIH